MEKEAAFKAVCQEAISELETARAKWLEKKGHLDASLESAHAEATRIRKDLQDKVDQAERSFKGLIAEKTAQLEQARSDAATEIDAAQHAVDDAQRDSDNAIREAQTELQRVKRDFENGFGSAERVPRVGATRRRERAALGEPARPPYRLDQSSHRQ